MAAASRPVDVDPYAPELQAIGTQITGTVYWFSDAQLARMAQSPLEAGRFIAYVEKRWPIRRLKEHCVSSNRWPRGYQNLVAVNCPIDIEIHKGKSHDFDRIRVYVSEDDGRGRYLDSAAWNWHRWSYSINVFHKRNHWGIIEQLPNDFMDSAEYGLSEQDGAANGSQPVRSETNRTPLAAGSRR